MIYLNILLVTIIGSLFLLTIAMLPILIKVNSQLPEFIAFGGTSLIIVISGLLQVDSYRKKTHYNSLLTNSKIKEGR